MFQNHRKGAYECSMQPVIITCFISFSFSFLMSIWADDMVFWSNFSDTNLFHSVSPAPTATNHREHIGVLRFCVAQIRFLFSLPENVIKDLLPNVNPPTHLAYVELFQPFIPAPDPDHGMYKVLWSLNATGEHLALIIPVDEIHQSVHLYPKFGPIAPRDWTSSNVLERCTQFYTNPWTDRHAYIMFS